jgi:protein TonB
MKDLAFLLALTASACRGPQSRETRPVPGEEPLETASVSGEEVVALAPETAPRGASKERSCLLAGVGGAPHPQRIDAAPVRLPLREPPPLGEITVEIVISPDGSVSEASLVSTTEPSWPEAEKAVLDAVKSWRYEPPTLGGTPISVCASVAIRP